MNTKNTQISPLRQRLLDDMQLRKLGPKSQSAYIRAIKKLQQFLGIHHTLRQQKNYVLFSCIWPMMVLPGSP